MFGGALYQLNHLWRAASPFVLGVILVLISLIPTNIPELSSIPPMLTLIAVFHWSLFRPDLLPVGAIFVLGLIQDLLGGGPMGVYTLMLLIVHGLVVSQRKFLFRKPFMITWIGFAMFSALAEVAAWALGSLTDWVVLDFSNFLFQYLITLGLFPPLALGLFVWERKVIREA